MKTQLLTTPDALEALAPEWDRLAGDEPLHGHAWLAGWWRHYGDAARGELHAVTVTDDAGQIVGLAPWRLERSLRQGATLRWLGDGEVCTDHPNLLVRPGSEPQVAEALADHLTTRFNDWQLLELTDVDQGEQAIELLAASLRRRGAMTEQLAAGSCWRLPLPDDWDGLLAMQSKSHRKQIRRSQRMMDSDGGFVWREAKTEDDRRRAWPILIDLHQRRRRSLGEPGCFASPRWAAFHEDVSRRLLERGRLRLFWLEHEGRPLTAEYLIASGGVWRAYQGGLDPDRADLAPGRLSLIHLIRSAIDQGAEAIDFMRGDEEYKPHWRAEPHATEHLRVVPPRLSALLRNQADGVARRFRGAARAGLRVLGRRS